MVLPASSPHAAPSRTRLGVAALLASSLVFGVMAMLVKLAAARLPGPEVALCRFVVGAAVVGVAAIGGAPMRPVNWRALFLRGFFGGLAVLGYFACIAHLSVGMATLLNYTYPLFTAFFAAAFLGERLGRSTGAALALTTVGVVLVVHGNARPGEFGFGPWQLVGLTSGVLSGAAVTGIRYARRTDGAWTVFGAFCAVGALACAPLAVASWVRPTAREWALLVGVGLLSVIAQMLLTWAMRYVRAATSGIINQLTPVTALVLGVSFLDEKAHPLALVGSALTLVGVALAMRPSSSGSPS
jgi:drug/metabolite transporter (DMT)-like permease